MHLRLWKSCVRLHKEIVAVAAVALPQSVYRSENLDPILVRIFTLLGLENGYKWV